MPPSDGNLSRKQLIWLLAAVGACGLIGLFYSLEDPLVLLPSVQRYGQLLRTPAPPRREWNANSDTDTWIRERNSKQCTPSFGALRLVYNETYGLCTTESGKLIIWVFWDYIPMPAYINLSIEALRCHNADFAHVEVVTDAKFRKFAIDAGFPLHAAFDKMIEAHKADYFRCIILLNYGGFYTDADMLHWNGLRAWFEKLAEGYDIFGYKGWPGEIIGITLLGPMRAKSALMAYWLHDTHLLLDAKASAFRVRTLVDYPLGWAEMLRNILQPRMHELVKDSAVKYFSIDAVQTMGLLQVTKLDRVLFEVANASDASEVEALKTVSKSDFPVFIYHHSGLSEKWKKMTDVVEFLATDVILVRLLRLSMERCEAKRKKIA